MAGSRSAAAAVEATWRYVLHELIKKIHAKDQDSINLQESHS
jgi:hypothetical protein